MNIFSALVFAFLPISVLAYLVTFFSYRSQGHLPDESKHGKEDAAKPNNLLHKKWLNFGGGYYGLMALITFMVIEAREVFDFVTNFPGMEVLIANLSINSLVKLLVNSFMNMVDAMVWFTYWPDQLTINNGWLWLGCSGAGYFLGKYLAGWKLHE